MCEATNFGVDVVIEYHQPSHCFLFNQNTNCDEIFSNKLQLKLMKVSHERSNNTRLAKEVVSTYVSLKILHLLSNGHNNQSLHVKWARREFFLSFTHFVVKNVV